MTTLSRTTSKKPIAVGTLHANYIHHRDKGLRYCGLTIVSASGESFTLRIPREELSTLLVDLNPILDKLESAE